ncbi:MAG TPA: hypothetical protein VG737_18465 [Cyclobacteriaceae bacterium]|nr:hypothetical protein [Cyclobacteriaceae bacterium]
MLRCRFSLIAFFIVLNAAQALGQAARSPFASIGLGEPFSPAITQNQGMGGIGISNYSYYNINNMNPALLVFNRLTSFQFGIMGEQRTQTSSTNDVTEKSGSGNLSYIALAIPIKLSKWTSSIGLQPSTRLNYRLAYQQPIGPATDVVTVTEEGTGGINAAYFSNGVAITKDFSIGLKASYQFGSIENKFTNYLASASVTPAIRETTYVTGFQFSPAVSVHLDSLFGADYRLNFGAVYDFGSTLNAKFTQWEGRYNGSSLVDSTTLINQAPGKVTLPQSMAGGISFGNSYRWVVGVDGYYADYSQFRDITGANPYTANQWRVNGGFEITPNPQSLTSYLQRVTYRTGVSLENGPYLVNGAAVRDFGITFGMSLPVSRSCSLDMAMKFGKKGDKTLNTIEENYLKLYFGITFNDQWFIKRRFD